MKIMLCKTGSIRRYVIFLISTVLAFAYLNVGITKSIAEDQNPTVLTAAVLNVTATIWPTLVAREKGFYKEEGLQVDLIMTGASPRSVQQVAAGVANVGVSSMVDTVRAIDAGANVKVFLNSMAFGVHSLIASKDIKAVTDLKTKRVMTGGQGDITNLWWMAMARKNGMDPNKDVQLLFSGSTANRMAALFAGGVDATVLSPPQTFKALEAGWTDLGPIAPYLGEFPFMIWHTNDEWAKMHPKLLVAFVRATNKAVRYMSEPAHRQEVSEILARDSKSDIEDALKTWDICMKVQTYVPNGAVSDSAVRRVVDALTTAGDIKSTPKDVPFYYDGKYVQAAKQ